MGVGFSAVETLGFLDFLGFAWDGTVRYRCYRTPVRLMQLPCWLGCRIMCEEEGMAVIGRDRASPTMNWLYTSLPRPSSQPQSLRHSLCETAADEGQLQDAALREAMMLLPAKAMRIDTSQLRRDDGSHRQRALGYHLQAATCLSYLTTTLPP